MSSIDAVHYANELEAQEKVRKWMEKIQNSAEDDGGLEIELYHHMPGEEEPSPIDVLDVDSSLAPDQIAKRVVAAATEYCEGMDASKIRFLARIDGVRKTCAFAIKIENRGTSAGGEIDEAPNMVGLIMQKMRHQEVLVDANANMVAKTSAMVERVGEMYQAICESQQKEIQNYRQMHIETIKAYEDINSMRHVRDLDMRKLMMSEKRMDQVAGLLMTGAPHLLNKFLGGGAGDGRPKMVAEDWSPLEQMLLGLIGTFDKETLEKLMGSGVLNPAQMMGFHQLLTAVFEKKEALEKVQAEQAAKAQANGQVNGQSPPIAGQANETKKEPAYQT